MIEVIYRTEDGREFDTEQEAVAHELEIDFRNYYLESGDTATAPGPNMLKVPLKHLCKADEWAVIHWNAMEQWLGQHKDRLLEYLTGENQPDPQYQSGVKRWDQEAVERIEPILVNGEWIFRPDVAWNAALDAMAGRLPNSNTVLTTVQELKLQPAPPKPSVAE